MPQGQLSLSTEQNTPSSASFKTANASSVAKNLRGAYESTGEDASGQARTDRKTERSPTSPRNFKSFFKSNGKSERSERVPNPRRNGSNSNMSAADLSGKPSSISHLYGAGNNNSTPSMNHGNAFDETASMKSAVSGVPESLRSDDEVNRYKTGSTTNIAEHAQRKGGRGTLSNNALQRSHSRRQTESQDRTQRLRVEQNTVTAAAEEKERQGSNPITAPPGRQDRAFREAMQAQQARNRSADRSAVESEDEYPASQAKTSQNTFFGHFRQHGAKAADGIGRAGKGIFGKLKESRSGSSHEKDNSSSIDLRGQSSILKEPLKEQTRRTRIKKTMDAARDKTEFWMPALPYRCIDYLNHHGIDSVGLYRIPGSTTEIKAFQQKFNSPPYDVDMLHPDNEPQDLNVAASLLKNWVRFLPEELLPKEVQDRIEKQAPNEKSTPQVMREELSNLPPYNYYLLFAITCHMSLLHAHREVNKMSYGALRTCWASLNVSAYVFQFLICDWRNCWQGCSTEQDQMVVEHDVIARIRAPSPTPADRLKPPEDDQPLQMPEQPLSGSQAAARFANAKSPERSEPPARPTRPERPGRATPPVQQTSSAKPHKDNSEPFSQDLKFAQKKPSTPDSSAPSHGPVAPVSPIRM